jgi:hypothetical protein
MTARSDGEWATKLFFVIASTATADPFVRIEVKSVREEKGKELLSP